METGGTAAGVSVIIRSMGRASLPRAFASVAAQASLPSQIVLVDASGKGLEAPASPVPVTLVRAQGGRLDRARAANAGMGAARGEWMGFLDEDDEFTPAHYETLLSAARSSRLPVAYSATRIVRSDGSERLLGVPFDRRALFRSNYITIHAPLFHRSFFDAGCRFDDTLEVFEDWDFWLQLAMRTAFAFTGEHTAIYHVDEGQSGGGGGSNLEREVALRHRERLMRKWAPSIAALDTLS